VSRPPRLVLTHAGITATLEPPPWRDPIDAREWVVRPIEHRDAAQFLERWHYAKGAANTSVARYGLYHREGSELLGAALFMPPIINAARRVRPSDPHGVLALSRLALHELAPHNSASFFIGSALRLLPERWRATVTYADEGRGHVGTIYQASNHHYLGTTRPMPTWSDGDGRLVTPKRGPKTYNKREMLERGYRLLGHHVRHVYLLERDRTAPANSQHYPKRATLFISP
jgi:hypothetical protein